MSKFLTDSTIYPAIAAAIRAKGGATGLLKPSEMPAAIRNISGGGSSAVLEPLIVTANGNYTPGVGVDGFDSVSVDVPNSYAEADEGKVVQSGALVAQTSLNVTANGTYDTTTNNSVVVDVEGGGGDDPLPLTDYIQSSGTQYINTGYAVSPDSRIEMVAEFASPSGTSNSAFGTRAAASGTSNAKGCLLYAGGSSSPNTLYAQFGGNQDSWNNMMTDYFGVKTVYRLFKNHWNIVASKWAINNSQNLSYSAAPTTVYPLYIFGVNNIGTANISQGFKLYRFRIYEGETLALDLVPAVDGSNVVCMRDSISGNYFYNQGTGVFTYGSDT